MSAHLLTDSLVVTVSSIPWMALSFRKWAYWKKLGLDKEQFSLSVRPFHGMLLYTGQSKEHSELL